MRDHSGSGDRSWWPASLLVAGLYIGVPSGPAWAGAVSSGRTVVRELAEELAEQAGRKSSRETIETMASGLGRIAGQCGDESLDVVRKHGVAAYRLLDKAGDDAAPLIVGAIRKYGDDAIRVGQTAAGRTLLREGSEQAVRAVARHSDAALPLIRRYGDDCAAAMARINPANGRRLMIMASEEMLEPTQLQRLMPMIGQYGDEAMDFIWRHRKLLVTAAVVSELLRDPEPYLNGACDLAAVLGNSAGEAVTQVGQEVIERINWNLWFGVAIVIAGGALVFRHSWRTFTRRSGEGHKR